eukprot:3463518-Rhodomonas_salina.1
MPLSPNATAEGGAGLKHCICMVGPWSSWPIASSPSFEADASTTNSLCRSPTSSIPMPAASRITCKREGRSERGKVAIGCHIAELSHAPGNITGNARRGCEHISDRECEHQSTSEHRSAWMVVTLPPSLTPAPGTCSASV